MLTAALVIAGIGAVSALGLGIAARVFAVAKDPKAQEVEEALPGANCGGCGYAGCSAAAAAVARGKAPPNVCVVGGFDVAQAVARIMDMTVGAGEVRLAELGCKYGRDEAHLRFEYDGVRECRAAALVMGGGKRCTMGCLGFGTCVEACQFGALSLDEHGLPVVDSGKCTACGACERICPKGIIRVQSSVRKFTHVQTSDDCVAPCQANCPAQIDIPAYIAAIAKGDDLRAVAIIKESNPLPLVCGRVCPHPCEAKCRRGEVDEPVNINHLKRFAADVEMRRGQHLLPLALPPTGKRVAVIGAGPAGLSAAFYLARLGHSVKIFESMPKPGGMLRYGIPEYRLPKAVLDFEIAGILALGVELECGVRLGLDLTIPALRDQGFDAVLVAVGAWASRRLGVPGEKDFAAVRSGTDFLIDLGREQTPAVGETVVVVGGGNTAMDAARTAWRLGAKKVALVYRRSRAEMPANDIEVHEGEKEGIGYHFLAAPTRLLGKDNALEGFEYQQMELGEPDASGRRRPVPVPGSETALPAATVLAAIGQMPELSCLDSDDLGRSLKRTKWESLHGHEGTMQTNVPFVFSGGDGRRGAATAVEAIRDGRLAARGIHQLLGGVSPSVPSNWYESPPALPGIDPGVRLPPLSRAQMPELSVDERRGNFHEVELGLPEEEARAEARRCLQCGEICYRGYRGKEAKSS